jgi:hypothetical protein
MFYCKSNTVGLQLSILSWTADDPEMQRIRIIELLFENRFYLADFAVLISVQLKVRVRLSKFRA